MDRFCIAARVYSKSQIVGAALRGRPARTRTKQGGHEATQGRPYMGIVSHRAATQGRPYMGTVHLDFK